MSNKLLDLVKYFIKNIKKLMWKIEFLEWKILEKDNLLDLRLGFELIEKFEYDIKAQLELFNNETKSIYDENSYDEIMIQANNDFFDSNEWFENFEIKMIKLELNKLIHDYKIELEKLFFIITDSFSKIKYRCDVDISRFFKLQIDNLIDDIDYINKDTVWKKMTSADLDMYYNNPYRLLYNTLVNHKDILQVYYNNLFSFDLDIIEQSNVISNWLHLSFSEINNLKVWEDSIEYKQFNVSDIVKPVIDDKVYTIWNLLRKD